MEISLHLKIFLNKFQFTIDDEALKTSYNNPLRTTIDTNTPTINDSYVEFLPPQDSTITISL